MLPCIGLPRGPDNTDRPSCVPGHLEVRKTKDADFPLQSDHLEDRETIDIDLPVYRTISRSRTILPVYWTVFACGRIHTYLCLPRAHVHSRSYWSLNSNPNPAHATKEAASTYMPMEAIYALEQVLLTSYRDTRRDRGIEVLAS